jgi:hypothetical protein
VRDGDDRLLVAAMPEDATIPGGYGAVRGTRRSEGGLDESSAQPDATFARLPRSVLASTLVALGTETGPTREMAVAGESSHVNANLGDEDFRRPLIHAGNRIKALHRIREGRQDRLDTRAQRGDRLLEMVEVRQDWVVRKAW